MQIEHKTTGKLTPARGNTVPMVVTEVTKDRPFSVESRIPLLRTVFVHELHPAARGGTVVTLSGPLVLLLGGALRRQMDAGLPVTLRHLKQLAEARGAAGFHDGRPDTSGALQ